MARSSIQPYLWMLLGSFAFSVMGTLAHDTGNSCDWQVVAMARSLIPFLLVGSWCLVSGVKLIFFRPPILWMRSIAGSFSLVGTFFALTQLPPYDVFTLTNMFPIWVALLSWPLLGEMPPRQVWLAVFSGFLGVILIQKPHLDQGNFAALVALGVSLFTALAMIGLHRLKGLDSRAIVVHFSGVSFLFALAAFFFFDHPRGWEHVVETDNLMKLLLLGTMASIGQILLTKAFTYGEPAKISVVGLTQIVFTLILASVFLQKTPDLSRLLGIPLVVAPTGWLMWQQKPVPPPDPELGQE